MAEKSWKYIEWTLGKNHSAGRLTAKASASAVAGKRPGNGTI